jgi:hypothetical protein
MEPRREELKAPKPRTEEKPKRFRIVKLEERIAPNGCCIGGKPGAATGFQNTNARGCTQVTCVCHGA